VPILRQKDYIERTPLHFAALSGKTEIVRELVLLGATVGVKDKNNTTPLQLAREGGHVETMNELIQLGATYPSSSCLLQ
jgi:ankyrin repeat protein